MTVKEEKTKDELHLRLKRLIFLEGGLRWVEIHRAVGLIRKGAPKMPKFLLDSLLPKGVILRVVR